MHCDISVTLKEQHEDRWQFFVMVTEGETMTKHDVALTRAYYEKVTKKNVSPEEFVKRSFDFLLAREPKESILRKFDISIIQRYFPEYESKVMGEHF